MFNRVQPSRVSLLLLLLVALGWQSAEADNQAARRQAMVAGIRDEVRATSRYLGSRTLTPQVLEAMPPFPAINL
ncbi:MAG: hypothetical protein OEY01_02410 [Desulfobulbaceae bacterium]|nr:hypothetical protein [Desulfobulbaceae bacterium]